jgi:hypothetical protein
VKTYYEVCADSLGKFGSDCVGSGKWGVAMGAMAMLV